MDLLIAAADTKRIIEECIGPSDETENEHDFVIPRRERRFPCKARGMHTEHTVTGFLTLPQGAIHGQDLFCSSRECFLEGVKFKYCAACDKAVAKRNFKKRHSHFDESGSTSAVIIGNKHSFSPYPSSDSSVEMRDIKQQRKVTVDSIDHRFSLNQCTPFYDADGSANKENRREPPPLWSDLYFSRPEDSNSTEMHEWLIRVIAVSKPITKPIIRSNEGSDDQTSNQSYSSFRALQPAGLNSHQSEHHTLAINDERSLKEDLPMAML